MDRVETKVEKPKLKVDRDILMWKQDVWKHGYIVLCYLGSDHYHSYVVWRVNEDGYTFSGEYCTSLEDAIAAFKERR